MNYLPVIKSACLSRLQKENKQGYTLNRLQQHSSPARHANNSFPQHKVYGKGDLSITSTGAEIRSRKKQLYLWSLNVCSLTRVQCEPLLKQLGRTCYKKNVNVAGS